MTKFWLLDQPNNSQQQILTIRFETGKTMRGFFAEGHLAVGQFDEKMLVSVRLC